MPTQSPPATAHNPATVMTGFMADLQAAGMDQAAQAEKEKAIAPATAPETPPAETTKPEPAKEQPKEAPKEAPKPEPASEEKWPRTAKDWEASKKAAKEREVNLQKERDSIREERDRLNKEIETIRKSGPSPELESLKKERDELSEHLRLIAVENHPKFKQYFDGKINQQIDLAKGIVGAEKAEKFIGLLKAPDGPLKEHQLEESLAELTPLQQTRIGGVINALAQINSERATEISKAKENFSALQLENDNRLKAERAKYETAFDTAVKSLQDPEKGIAAFQTRDGDDAWNTDVQKRIDSAKVLLSGNGDVGTVIKSALMAVAAPEILRGYQSVLQENDSLKKQIQEMSAANPTVDTKTKESTSETVQPVRPKAGSSPMDVLASSWMQTIKQDMQ